MNLRRLAGALLVLSAAALTIFVSVALAATLTLTPSSATNFVGQQHCVTATVTGANNPNFSVGFTVTTTSGSAVAVPDQAEVPADGNGQATFCFTSATPGTVQIYAEAHGTNTQSRPNDTATKTFILPDLPTDKDQCKKGGWQNFGVFKNQGDCVSFVATGGKNQPAG
jgi:hypothetical protein